MNHYGGAYSPPNNGATNPETHRTTSGKIVDRLRPSPETKQKIRNAVDATKNNSAAFLQKLKELSTQMYQKIKERIAADKRAGSETNPGETVVRQQPKVDSNKPKNDVLQRYQGGRPAVPKKGFVPDENIREQRRARRRQRQKNKAKEEDRDPSEEREADSNSDIPKVNPTSLSADPRKTKRPAVANPLFSEDNDEEIEESKVTVPVPVSKTQSRHKRNRSRPNQANHNPLFVDV